MLACLELPNLALKDLPIPEHHTKLIEKVVQHRSNAADASAGQVTLSLNDTQTTGLESGRYVYDLNITKTSSSETTRVVEGQAILTPGVTR